MQKQIIVISGGGGYLGNIIVKKFTEHDYVVVAVGPNVTREASDLLVNALVHTIDADVTRTEDTEAVAEKVNKEFGKVYAIIHAASPRLIRRPALSGSCEDFESQFSVNVKGAFNLCKSLYPLMLSGGAIIGITTRMIDVGTSYMPSGSYIAAKYALKGFLRILFNELKDKSIRVYGVAPAFMPGGLNKDIPLEMRELILKKSKSEDIAKPEEVAEVILNLVNDTEKKLNGKSITVPDGIVTNL